MFMHYLCVLFMVAFFKKYRRFAWVMITLSAIIIVAFYQALKPVPVLPIYQPAMVDASLVDETIQYIKKYHTIGPFKLTNQNGQTITEKDYENTIYVADFFFTTCPSICPIMTDNMVELQNKLEDRIKLLSFSVTPEIDDVPVLKEYAELKGVDDKRWNLVTGPKQEIYALARKSYLVVQEDGDGGPYDMIHTENFVLIDKKKRIRGFYDGTNMEAVEQLILDIEILELEVY